MRKSAIVALAIAAMACMPALSNAEVVRVSAGPPEPVPALVLTGPGDVYVPVAAFASELVEVHAASDCEHCKVSVLVAKAQRANGVAMGKEKKPGKAGKKPARRVTAAGDEPVAWRT